VSLAASDFALRVQAAAIYRARDYRALAQLLGPRIELHEDRQLGFLLATAWSRLGQWPDALRVSLNLLRKQRGENSRTTRLLLNAVGVAYLEQGNLKRASQALRYLVARASEADDQRLLAWANTNLGIIADQRCHWEEAVAFYTRARVSLELLGQVRELASVHCNLGITYRQLGMVRDALDQFEHAIAYGSIEGSADDVALYQLAKAELLLGWGQPALAQAIAERCLIVSEQVGNLARVAECRRVLGGAALRMEQGDRAIELLHSAIRRAREASAKGVYAQCLQDCGEAYSVIGQHKAAARLLWRAHRAFAETGASRRSKQLRRAANRERRRIETPLK
jgi:tetratricopeptide (TPR) repeat protein